MLVCLFDKKKGLSRISKGKEKVNAQNITPSIHSENLDFGNHE